MARRRGRFARGTSGSQNLTTLIYSILKEQQTTKKSAILNAFDANMNSRTYSATFAGQPADREAVEAYYMDLMRAYPEGSIERDNLRAEMIDFHNRAINKEIDAYARAYKEGTNAFGEKIDLNKYLAFLRNAKSETSSDDDKGKYNLEEFLVTFNDVHDDLKAEGAGPGALASFYRRELGRAVDMGITKDSDSYRTIQQYLATASKAGAAAARQQAAQDAVDGVSERMSVVSGAISDSLAAAVASGRITAQDSLAVIGDNSPNGIVSRFSSLDLSIKQRIFLEGERAGVKIDGEAFTAETFVSNINETREKLKMLIANGSVDASLKSVYRTMLGRFDEEVAGPVGLMTDLESATNSALDLVIDNESGLGNPVINVEAYKNHSSTIGGSGASAVAGQAMLDILNGKVPNPEEFGGKTDLWQLTPVEQSRLAESYTGNAYIATGGMQDPLDFISTVIKDYTDAHNVSTGSSFVTAGIDADGNASVSITDDAASGGTPFIYSVKLSNGKVVPVVGRQVTQDILSTDGSKMGTVIFDIDQNGKPKKSFITMDGFKMDYDKFEQWIDSKGIRAATDTNGNVQVNIVGTDPQMAQVFMGSTIKQDSFFGTSVSTTPWNGVAEGEGADAARRLLGKQIADNLVTGVPGSISIDQATGSLIVSDPLAALRDYGINAQDLETVINANTPGSDYNGVKTAIGDALFRVSERQSLTPSQLKPGEKAAETVGIEAAAQLEGKRRREENAARLYAEGQAGGRSGFDPITAAQALLGIGAGKGPRELQLEQIRADATRIEAERRAMEVESQQGRQIDPNVPIGSGPTPFSTINKDPIASFFLRNTGFMNPEATKISGPSSLGATKIGSAPALSTKISPPSMASFRASEKAALGPVVKTAAPAPVKKVSGRPRSL